MQKKSGVATVFLAVLIDLMGFGIVLPLLPFYAENFHVVPWKIGILYSIYSFAQLIFSPFWGSLSDRIGRRPVMLVSTLGSVIAYIVFALSNSYGMLFISRLIAGIMGGNIATAQAYIADVTTHEDRAKGMGLIGAAFGIGFVMGPALSTILIHPQFVSFLKISPEHLFMLPGFAASTLSLISFLLVLTKLEETVKEVEPDDSERVKREGIFTRAFWRTILEEKKYAKHFFPILMLSMFVLSFGYSSLYSSFPLYCQSRLHLTPQEVGMLFVYMGIITAFIQGSLMKPLTKKFSEEFLFLTGSILMVIGFVLVPYASTKISMSAYLCLVALGASLCGPTLTSLISKESDPSELGKTMGTAQGISGLGRAIGPTWGGFLYGLSYRLPFLATAGVLFITIYAGIKLHRAHHDFKHFGS